MSFQRRGSAMDLARRAGARYVGANSGSVAPTPYLGQVATRCYTPNAKSAGGLTQSMNRTRHIARDAITSVQLMFANWYQRELAVGNTATITASVEYPAGTFTQVLFSGIAAGSIANGGQILSDAASVSIPDGATFFVRSHFTCASGFPYNLNSDPANGDVIAYAVSGLADKTMSNPMPANAGTLGYAPMAIIGMTSKASVLLIGDSRCAGFSDVATGTSGDSGEIARSVGPARAYINSGCFTETPAQYITTHTQRAALWPYCSHVVSNYAINSLVGSATAADIYAGLASIRGYFAGKPFYQTTIPPGTTSSDGWATTVNQTVTAYNAARITLNALIRANSNGFDGWFEVADVVETARDSGIWLAPGYTPDGVHDTNTANLAIQASGNINPAVFVR